jgi:hypothetical protein
VPDWRASWEFVQSSGGLQIGSVESLGAEKWRIAIDCDVSGLKRVTRDPITFNSGVVVMRVAHKIEGRRIFISLILNSPSTDSASSMCPPLILTDTASGKYELFYRADGIETPVGELILETPI